MRTIPYILAAFLLILVAPRITYANPVPGEKQDFLSLNCYLLQTKQQEEKLDLYLKNALLPALHRLGISQVGVFKAVGNDTAAIRRTWILIPFHNAEQFLTLTPSLQKDKQYLEDGKDYLDAAYNDPPYVRIESILLQSFPDMPHIQATATLKAPLTDRIYELRSYEGPTEKYFLNKVQMFNEGGEIPFFKRLDFNAVFYASVLSGPRMPNLMYMVCFDNMEQRNAHWKAFGDDPFWKKLSAAPEYQHNVSHVDNFFLHPAAYSEL